MSTYGSEVIVLTREVSFHLGEWVAETFRLRAADVASHHERSLSRFQRLGGLGRRHEQRILTDEESAQQTASILGI